MNIDLDHELESNPEYRRILAELSPDERLRLLGTDFSLQHELDKKRNYRRKIAALPPAEKLRILEELRRRAQMQKGSRRSKAHPASPSVCGGRAKRRSGVTYEVPRCCVVWRCQNAWRGGASMLRLGRNQWRGHVGDHHASA